MRKKTYLIMAIIIVAIIALDQWTKYLAIKHLKDAEAIVIIPRFLSLSYHENTGMGFGFLQGQTLFFIVVTIIALIVFIAMAHTAHFKKNFFYSLGITLLIGGTIGNFIDRLFREGGKVIDMIDAWILSDNFPIFNIADMALTIGFFALAIDIFIFESLRRKNDEKNV